MFRKNVHWIRFTGLAWRIERIPGRQRVLTKNITQREPKNPNRISQIQQRIEVPVCMQFVIQFNKKYATPATTASRNAHDLSNHIAKKMLACCLAVMEA